MDMQVTVNDQMVNDFSKAIIKNVLPQIQKALTHDETVTRDYLMKNVFHCGTDTIIKIVSQSGFPRTQLVKDGNYKYSLKAVDKWIAENQKYQF